MIFVAVGCHGDPPADEVFTHEGEHVVMLAESGLELCGGSMAYMDEFVRRLSSKLGVDAPRGDERIRYHWESPEVIEKICEAPVGGCAPGGEVFSQYAPHNHELVHGVAAVFGLPLSMFAEGLAVAHEGLGASPDDHYSLGSADDVLALVDASQQEFAALGGYRLAGAFTAYLIERYGMESYLAAYAQVDRNSRLDHVEQAFSDAFGASLQQSIAEFEAQPNYLGAFCAHGSYDAKLIECSAPEISWDGARLSLVRRLACEDDDVVGPFDGKTLGLYTIAISAAGRYELRMHGDLQDGDPYPDFGLGDRAVTGVSLRRCGGCGDGEWMATWEGSTPRVNELRPGIYSLRLHGSTDASVTVGFTLSLLPEPPEPSSVLDGGL